MYVRGTEGLLRKGELYSFNRERRQGGGGIKIDYIFYT